MDIRCWLAGRLPIKVYSMSLYPLFPHFLRVFGSPPNFPFTGSGAHSLGVMFTLGLPPCSEFLNLIFFSITYIASSVPKSVVAPIFIVQNKTRLLDWLMVLFRVLFEIEHTGEFLRANILHLSAEPGTAICFDKKCIFREILLEPRNKVFYGHISLVFGYTIL